MYKINGIKVVLAISACYKQQIVTQAILMPASTENENRVLYVKPKCETIHHCRKHSITILKLERQTF